VQRPAKPHDPIIGSEQSHHVLDEWAARRRKMRRKAWMIPSQPGESCFFFFFSSGGFSFLGNSVHDTSMLFFLASCISRPTSEGPEYDDGVTIFFLCYPSAFHHAVRTSGERLSMCVHQPRQPNTMLQLKSMICVILQPCYCFSQSAGRRSTTIGMPPTTPGLQLTFRYWSLSWPPVAVKRNVEYFPSTPSEEQ
jgi:hypothetical protein